VACDATLRHVRSLFSPSKLRVGVAVFHAPRGGWLPVAAFNPPTTPILSTIGFEPTERLNCQHITTKARQHTPSEVTTGPNHWL
jgi:hypothetical protein